MHLIVYTSESNLPDSEASKALLDISKTAKMNNPSLDVTGLLFYHNHRFVQIIEGEKASLEKLISRIERDVRHKHVQRIIDEEIKRRGFEEWNMDSFNLTASEVIDPAELVKISEAIKRNVSLNSAVLAKLFKTLLASGQLRLTGHR